MLRVDAYSWVLPVGDRQDNEVYRHLLDNESDTITRVVSYLDPNLSNPLRHR